MKLEKINSARKNAKEKLEDVQYRRQYLKTQRYKRVIENKKENKILEVRVKVKHT